MLMPMIARSKPAPPAPFNVHTELYDGTKVRLLWDGTDATMFPQVRVGFGAPNELAAGSSQWNSGQFSEDLWVRHRRGNKFSEWISALV